MENKSSRIDEEEIMKKNSEIEISIFFFFEDFPFFYFSSINFNLCYGK